jgi:hypothetical protein
LTVSMKFPAGSDEAEIDHSASPFAALQEHLALLPGFVVQM